MAVLVQNQGRFIGHHLGYTGYDDVESWASWYDVDLLQVANDLFGVFYILEQLFKMYALGWDWVSEWWNWFDLTLCMSFVISKSVHVLGGEHANGVKGKFMLLRAGRVFRLLRLIKVIKHLKGFDSLHLLVATLQGSVHILFWSCVLLVCIQFLISFAMFFVLSDLYLDNDAYDMEGRVKVFEYFGTFSRTVLTMFELSLANWPPVCRLLTEHISEWFMLFFIAYKLTMGFAVINVVNGVFMQETFKVASSDDSIIIRQKQRDVELYSRKIEKLFLAADADHKGIINFEEFLHVVEDKEISLWMSSLDLPVRDPKTLFELLDENKTGFLATDGFIRGVLRLRGGAKTFDIVSLGEQVQALRRTIESSGLR
jgi:hypothetical protein